MTAIFKNNQITKGTQTYLKDVLNELEMTRRDKDGGDNIKIKNKKFTL